jgi:hypothetical protein
VFGTPRLEQLRVLCGVQDGAEVDALPGQASPECLKAVTGLAVAHRDRREDEVTTSSGAIGEVEVAGLVAEQVHGGHSQKRIAA